MDDSNRVKAFFEKEAKQFDAFYLEEEKPFYWKVLDFLFRRSIHRRLELTLQECQDEAGIRILDVGCGSARCAVKLAQRGHRVTGVDFSSEMIKLARRVAEENRVNKECHFILVDFKEVTLEEKFDVSIALGFFDYTGEPQEYLRKIKKLTKGKIIASFPAKWRLRNIIRIIRLRILRCPIYFYTTRRIENILKDVSIRDYQIKNLGRDYLVVAKIS